MEKYRNMTYGAMLLSMAAGILTDWPKWAKTLTIVFAALLFIEIAAELIKDKRR